MKSIIILKTIQIFSTNKQKLDYSDLKSLKYFFVSNLAVLFYSRDKFVEKSTKTMGPILLLYIKSLNINLGLKQENELICIRSLCYIFNPVK